ncbi:MAG: 3-dehydroquinate synthase [Clostridiales bacterium]|nr:3-dehydroquinate synthase [Clostridiales bacterium]
MRTVHVNAASKSYDVLIGKNAVLALGEEAKKVCPGALKALIVSETNVAGLYLDTVTAQLEDAGFEVIDYVFEAGEQNKNINEIAGMWNKMAEAGFTRTDFVVGLGGGVTTDMAGFAASTFLRGIKVIQLPTSLLAMVDASVGGKTGIDIPMGKNLVGAFWQPSLVLEDISFLKTLPDEVFTEGMGEVTKHAFIMDTELFEKLEKANGNIRSGEDLLEEIVFMNVSDKASIVGEDETDNGRRQTLNFGHTVGHVIERDSGFTKPHGICVAKGMGIVIDACVRAGTLEAEEAEKMKNLLKLYKLPTEDDITPEAIVEGAMNDKKKRGDTLSVILVNKIGRAEIRKMNKEEFLKFLSV